MLTHLGILSFSVPSDVTAAEGLTLYLLSGLSVWPLCNFLSALYCGFPRSRSCCLPSHLCVFLLLFALGNWTFLLRAPFLAYLVPGLYKSLDQSER